jgi:hypothetical protein
MTCAVCFLSVDKDSKQEFQQAQRAEWESTFKAVENGKSSGNYRLTLYLLTGQSRFLSDQ